MRTSVEGIVMTHVARGRGYPVRRGGRTRTSLVALLTVVTLGSFAPPAVARMSPAADVLEDDILIARPADDTASVVDVQAVPIDVPAGGAASEPGTAVNGGVDLRQPALRYSPPTSSTEIASERGRNRRVTANVDGTFTLEASTGKLHYRSTDGSWQPLDLSLIDDDSGDYDLRVAANDVEVRLGRANAAVALASASAAGHTISLRALGYGGGELTGANLVSYPGLGLGPSLQLRPTDDGFEFGATFIDARRSRGLQFIVDTGDLGAEVGPDGSIVLRDAQGNLSGMISAPAMLDARGEPAPASAVTLGVLGPPIVEPEPSASPGPSATRLPSSTPVPSGLPGPSLAPSVAPAPSGSSGPAPSQMPAIESPGPTPSPEPSMAPTASVDPAPSAEPSVEPTTSPEPSPMPSASPEPPVPAEASLLRPSELLLTYTVAEAWLADPARSFPVTLDPTFCIGQGASGATGCDGGIDQAGNFDHFVGSLATPANNWTVTRVGYDSDGGTNYGVLRSLIYFSDTILPDGAVITDTELKLRTSSFHGGPAGETINAYKITKGWSQASSWSSWSSGAGYTTGNGVAATVPGTAGGYMTWDPDAIVREWYMRRPKDWKPNLGFALKMTNEGSAYGEVMFKRYNDDALDDRPILRITYNQPKVRFDFDPALGPNYAPASMLAAQTTRLPIRVTNNGSGFPFTKCATTADCYQVGYRFFDAEGAVAGSGKVDLAEDIPEALGTDNPTDVFGLDVTAPSTPGQYTLRLDLVSMIGGAAGTSVWASDSARPSLYYSRVKNALSADNTRWTGSSFIEREEFGIAVTLGGGAATGTLERVTTGTGDTVGIDLASGNLRYEGDTGLGFTDLVPVGLTYGYDSKDAANCATKSIVLDACGWYTNWDERVEPGEEDGSFVYQDANGDRSFVATDGSEQLVSSAPVHLERGRVTYLEENVIPTADWTGTQPTLLTGGGYQGSLYYQMSTSQTSPSATETGAPDVNLNQWRYASFALRTTSASGAAIVFTVKNQTTGTAYEVAYIVGASYTVPGADATIVASASSPAGVWRFVSHRDVLADVQAQSGWGDWPDAWSVTGFKIVGSGGSSSIFVDSVFFDGRGSMLFLDGTPAWTSNGSLAQDETQDVFEGTKSLRILPSSYLTSPNCDPCTGGQRMTEYPFATWAWKKVGGNQASMSFGLDRYQKQPDGSITIQATAWITYYAGPVPPSGAVNAIQVADEVPSDWTVVWRNLAADAAQVFNWYNDDPTGSSEVVPAGPSPDPLKFHGWKVTAGDGNHLLIDHVGITSTPGFGGSNFGTSQWGVASATAFDFLVTDAAFTRHYFSRDGQLLRLASRDGHTVTLDWTRPAAPAGGLVEYELDKVHAPTDATISGPNTYDREIDVTRSTAFGKAIFAFDERLGTGGIPIAGRRASIEVATLQVVDAAIGDVIAVSPARDNGACGTEPDGCSGFRYNGSAHRLTWINDPRTSNREDWSVAWSGAMPIAIENSSGTPVLTVHTYNNASGFYRTPLITASAQRGAVGGEYAQYRELSPDGRERVVYAPQPCAAGDCDASGNWPSVASAAELTVNEFDGLARISKVTAYRTATGTPQQTIARQATRAGAKVDNFAEPLTASKLAWSQTADQQFASMKDSAGATPDLYRTTYTYDYLGGVTAQSSTVPNSRLDFARTVGDLSSSLRGHWRLGEAAGSTLVDSAGAADNGTYTGGPALSQPGALVGDSNTAASFNGSGQYARVTGATLGTVTAPFTVAAWAKVDSNLSNMAIVGTRGPSSNFTFDMKFQPGVGIHGDIGTGSGWLTTAADVRMPYEANRWYHVVYVVEAAGYSIYVDGKPAGGGYYSPVTPARLTDASHDLYIGQFGGNGEYLDGGIDEVMLFTEALDPPRVAAIFAAGHDGATVATQARYDRIGRPIQATDQFLANAGFEGGLSGWRTSGTGVTGNLVTSSGASTVHAGRGSLKITNTSSYAQQDVTLVPGQTVRVQAWGSATSGATPKIDFQYWSGGSWLTAPLGSNTWSGSAWAGKAWDVTLPLDGADGRARIKLTSTTAGTAYLDDVVVLTSWAATTYTSTAGGDPFNGLPRSITTLPLTQAAGGSATTLNAQSDYTASAAHAAMFPTQTTVNRVNGIHEATDPADVDLITTTTFDAWGRGLTSTDPDGVTVSNVFATNKTDVASVMNDFGAAATTYSYDAVGNRLSTTTPLGLVSSTTYDLFNHALTETARDGVVSAHEYSELGFRTESLANYRNGFPADDGSGIDDVLTTYEYDEFGRLVHSVADAGGIAAESATTYDLLGNVESSTTYSGPGTAGPRTTTQFFETYQVPSGGPLLTRRQATGVRLPIDPGTSSPDCPGAPSSNCNSASYLDAAGRVVSTFDAYVHETRTDVDLAGHPVRTIKNFVDGVYDSALPDRDLVASAVYSPFGQIRRTKDAAGLVAATDYDAVGRATAVTSYDTSFDASQPTLHRISVAKTTYTPGGRVRLSSPADDPALSDASRTWARSAYDRAGRAVKTLLNVDWGGAAGIAIDNFEDRIVGSGASGLMLESADDQAWSSAALGSIVAAGAAVSLDDDVHATAPRTGRARLRLDTAATANQGVHWSLSGTYKTGSSYRARVYVRGTGSGTSPTLEARFVTATGTTLGSPSTAAAAGAAWIALDVPAWTPASNTTGVRLVVRQTNAVDTEWFVDDSSVWNDTQWLDAASTGSRAFATPESETVYDADGRIVETIAPPGSPGEAGMPTGTVLDPGDRPVTVTNAETRTYASIVRSDGPARYWPLDDPAGTGFVDAIGGVVLTAAGNVGRGAPAAIDESRPSAWFDGSTGYGSRSTATVTVTNNWALEAWIRLDRQPTSVATVVRNGTTAAGYGIGVDTDRSIVWFLNGTTTDSGKTVAAGTWHHLVLARQGGTTRLYVDGIEEGPTSATSPSVPGASFAVGRADAVTSAGYFPGIVDEVAVYSSSTFDVNRVTAHYKAGRRVSDPSQGDHDPSSNLTSRTAVDRLGRTTEAWDPLLRRTIFEHDRLGRMTATTANAADGITTDSVTAGTGLDDDVRSTFGYNALGEMLNYCPARNVHADACDSTLTSGTSLAYRSAWHFAFDKLGRMTRQSPPIADTFTGASDLAAREWVYDARGRLRTVRDIWDAIGTQPSDLCPAENNAFRYVSTPATSAYDWLGRVTDQKVFLCPAGTATEKVRTVTAYETFGTKSTAYHKDGSASATDALTTTYEPLTGRPDQLKRDTAVLTDWSWNPDGTIATRLDKSDTGAAITGFTFTYDWANRQIAQQTAAGQTDLLGGTVRWSNRLDGLLDGRSWPGFSATAKLTYDPAKRPTKLQLGPDASVTASFTKAYDRSGNTIKEGRTVPAAGSGTNGSLDQAFSYDGLDRLLRASLNGTTTDYEYDLDGNRRKASASTFSFDRTDRLLTGPNGAFAYDRYGNLTTSREAATAVAYEYDAADRLTKISAGGTDTTMSLDALGRIQTRAVGTGGTTTYSYLGRTESVVRIDEPTTSGVDVDAVLSSDGSRLLVKQTNPTVASGWLVPDLHGNVAAAANTAGTVTAAIRYDGWGAVIGTPYSAALAPNMPWRFQGRLDIAGPAAGGSTGAPVLYDLSARNYSPGLGAFTSLDSVLGSAQDPRTMNRYLYALANPWTLVDPTGHRVCTATNFPECDKIVPAVWEPPSESGTGGDLPGDGTSEDPVTSNAGASPPPSYLGILFPPSPTAGYPPCGGPSSTVCPTLKPAASTAPLEINPVDAGLTACSVSPTPAAPFCDGVEVVRAIEKGDIVGVVLAGIGLIPLGGDAIKGWVNAIRRAGKASRVSKAAVDTMVLIRGLEKGELKLVDDVLESRRPVVPYTVAQEFLKKGDPKVLEQFLLDRGGYLSRAVPQSAVDDLVKQSRLIGKVLDPPDAAHVASALEEGAIFITNDGDIFDFLTAAGLPVELFPPPP